MEGVRDRRTNMHMNWEFSVASRVHAGHLDFKQEFYLYLEFGVSQDVWVENNLLNFGK